MKKISLITDSGCDLPQSIIEKYNIKVAPMKILFNKKEYLHYYDYRELSMEEFYRKIYNGEIGITSCASVGDIISTIKPEMEKGNDILYLSFSSGMSGSYNSAIAAYTILKEQYPDSKIKIIDTLSGCLGLGLLVLMAIELIEQKYEFDEIISKIEQERLNICHYFSVEDLDYIHRTGRISSLEKIAGFIVGIRPIFKINNYGKVELSKKIRGHNQLVSLFSQKATLEALNKTSVFICYTDNDKYAKNIKNKLKTARPDLNIFIVPVGPILANNTGPGATAIIYHGCKR